MIKESLERIGLTPGESEVYEALVSLGLSSAGVITKKSGIASSKVYEVLQRLQKKWKKTKRKYFLRKNTD